MRKVRGGTPSRTKQDVKTTRRGNEFVDKCAVDEKPKRKLIGKSGSRRVYDAGTEIQDGKSIPIVEKRFIDFCEGDDSLLVAELENFSWVEKNLGKDLVPRINRLTEDGKALIQENLKANGMMLIEFESIGSFLEQLNRCSNSEELWNRFLEIKSYLARENPLGVGFLFHSLAVQINPEIREGRLVFIDLDHVS